MFVVRNVFRTKPGKAGALADKFKAAGPLIIENSETTKSVRVLTDAVAGFWTVVVESEVASLDAYLDMAVVVSQNPQIGEALAGYQELVLEGYREAFQIA